MTALTPSISEATEFTALKNYCRAISPSQRGITFSTDVGDIRIERPFGSSIEVSRSYFGKGDQSGLFNERFKFNSKGETVSSDGSHTVGAFSATDDACIVTGSDSKVVPHISTITLVELVAAIQRKIDADKADQLNPRPQLRLLPGRTRKPHNT